MRRTSSGSRPQRARDVVENRLDHHHGLRSAEAAERGVRHGVGLAAMRGDLDVFQVVGVVDVKHGAIIDRAGKIGRIAAARGQHHATAPASAPLIEAHLVVGDEVMPLAGHQHVGVAVEAQLDRACRSCAPARPRRRRSARPGFPCRRSRRPCAGIAPRCDWRGLARACATMLCTSVGCCVELWTSMPPSSCGMADRDLSFQVEMILAADDDGGASDAAQRRAELRARIAAPHGLTGQHIALGGQRGADVEQRGERRHVELRAAGRLARGAHRVGGDGEQRLPGILHQSCSAKIGSSWTAPP